MYRGSHLPPVPFEGDGSGMVPYIGLSYLVCCTDQTAIEIYLYGREGRREGGRREVGGREI